MQTIFSVPQRLRRGAVAAGALLGASLLGACTGGSTDVQQLADLTFDQDTTVTYSGPPPQTEDVQAFRINLWDNVNGEDRCGACHVEGGQSPQFARSDDINEAYQIAGPLSDLNNPGQSRLVTKVAGGHNCWLESDAACADILTGWIAAWAGSTEATIRQIALTPPPMRDPGASRVFPDDSGLFATTVHPIVTTYCAQCHTSSAAVPVGPYFASDDIEEAYQASKTKIDLTTPEDSRFVARLTREFHNCWSGDCVADGATMLAAVNAMRDGIPLDPIDPTLVTSRAVRLTDGIAATGGGRYESNMIAQWEFKTGTGATAFDTSGVDPALDLTLSGDVDWVGSWGLRFRGGRAQGSVADSAKLSDLIRATGEYAVEAWVIPANVSQEGPARIVSYSGGNDVRNFTLGQTLYQYNWMNRNALSDANGTPSLDTDADTEFLQATLQHVVLTYDALEGRRIYVNGEYTGDPDPSTAESLTDWDDTFALVLGNETSGAFPFEGVIRFLSIYNRSMTPEQIMQNYEAGVGARFYLLFSVGEWVGINDAYVVFEVSQFDDYGYLFDKPYFISLSGAPIDTPIPLEGMFIGMNGTEVKVGQAFGPLRTELGGAAYDPATGQVLSSQGTTVALQLGSDQDEFFLSFDRIGAFEHVRTAAVPVAGAPSDLPPAADIGVRTFAAVNGTFKRLTGVEPEGTPIGELYQNIMQALPTAAALDSFVAAQQMAITQLAIGYCDAMINDNGLRSAMFPAVDFDAPPQTALSDRSALIDPLLDGFVNPELGTQADRSTIEGELNALVDTLSTCAPNCSADRTRNIGKAACAAVLGSASSTVF